MFTTYEQAQADIKEKFEGGISFNLDWSTLSKEGARALRRKISPATIKRRVPVYGGVSVDLPVYTCPTDVHTPAELYPAKNLTGDRSFDHTAPDSFFREDRYNKYTIDHINGIPFIYADLEIGQSAALLTATDDTAFTGVSLTATLRNFLTQTRGLYGTFTDAAYGSTWTFATAKDLTNYLRGVVLIPFEAATNVAQVASISIILYTDDSNYYTISTTNDVIGNTFTSGWNFARLDMATAVATGSPTIANITKAQLEIPQTTGTSQEITIDNISIHQTEAAFLEYYSNKNFRNAAGTWIEAPTADTDVVLFTDEAYDVWQYEVANLIVQNATYDGIDSREATRIQNQLDGAYSAYLMKFPSMQKPVSYNIQTQM